MDEPTTPPLLLWLAFLFITGCIAWAVIAAAKRSKRKAAADETAAAYHRSVEAQQRRDEDGQQRDAAAVHIQVTAPATGRGAPVHTVHHGPERRKGGERRKQGKRK